RLAGALGTVNPGGIVSLNPTPVSDTVPFRAGLVILNVRLVVALCKMVAAPKLLAITGGAIPMPPSGIDCVAGLPLLELSVSTTVAAFAPLIVGRKLMLRLQRALGASERVLVQSAGVPEPAPCVKLALLIAMPGLMAFSDWLPIFSIVTDRGLSLLVI